MKKYFLMLFVLAFYCIVNAGTSDLPEYTGQALADGDTLVYPGGDLSAKPMILHRGNGYGILRSYEPESTKPKENGLILDVPANDDCANAQAIGEVENIIASTVDATVDGGNFSNFPNIWYLYTPTTTGRIKAEISYGSDSGADGGRIAVYDGATCPDYVNIPEPAALQGGEDIETAVSITGSLPLAITGYFDENTRDYTECSCMFEHDYTGSDVVYSYTATSDDSVTFILIGENSQVGLAILDEDGNDLACQIWSIYEDEDGAKGPAIINFPVVAGETYYVLVSCYYNMACNDYTLMMYSPDNAMIDISYPSKHYHGYINFDAVAGNQYLIEVSYEEPSETSVLSVGLAPDPPENDSCINATNGGVIEPGTTIQFTGDNTGATETDYSIMELPEVWIEFTIEDTLDVVLDYCGNTSINNFIAYSLVITRDCVYSEGEWYYGESDDYFPDCPNMSICFTWENLPPGTYHYAMIVHHDYEGPYVINVTARKKPQCEDDALFGQIPTDLLSNYYEFYSSDIESGYAIADKFSGLSGMLNEITWWGIYLDTDGEEACVPSDPYPFQITICNFDETSPYLPGDTVGVYDVEATLTETGYVVNEYYEPEFPQYKLVAALPETLDMENGWLMIRGNDGFNECGFGWQDSDDGSYGVVYDCVANTWTRTQSGLAFCLGDAQVDIDDDTQTNLPLSYELLQNYPNPFNATTTIQFSLKESDNVSLTVYDIGGRLIRTLHNGELNAGYHTVIWDGTNQSGETVSSGIYFYSLKTTEQVFNNRMVLLK